MNSKKEDIYELNFGQLIEEKTGIIDENQNVFNAKVNVAVSIGNITETIKNILDLKEGSIIKLNKNVDEKLDIYANDRLFAYGESIITNETLSVRLSKIEDSDVNYYFKKYPLRLFYIGLIKGYFYKKFKIYLKRINIFLL